MQKGLKPTWIHIFSKKNINLQKQIQCLILYKSEIVQFILTRQWAVTIIFKLKNVEVIIWWCFRVI